MGLDSFLQVLDKSSITEYAKEIFSNTDYRDRSSLAIIDIDNFKNVNDSHGHMYGDEVLKNVSEIIKEALGDKGVLGRIGGDEFMIVTNCVGDYQQLREILSAVRVGIERMYDNKAITCSIGACIFDDYANNYDDIFNLADKMLYRAKQKGKNRYIIFRTEVHGDALKHSTSEYIAANKKSMQDRESVVLHQMDYILSGQPIVLEPLIKEIALAFDLDEVTIISNRNNVLSSYEKEPDLVPKNTDCVLDPSVLECFNENNMLSADDPERGLTEIPKLAKLSEYMLAHGITEMLVYHMKAHGGRNFVYFIKKSASSRKWESTDILLLTVICKLYDKQLQR